MKEDYTLTNRGCKPYKIIKYYPHDGSMHLATSGNCVQLAVPLSESSTVQLLWIQVTVSLC